MPSPDGIAADLLQTFKEEIIAICFTNSLKKIRRGEETLPNSLYKVNITMILKVDKRHHKRTLIWRISHEVTKPSIDSKNAQLLISI